MSKLFPFQNSAISMLKFGYFPVKFRETSFWADSLFIGTINLLMKKGAILFNLRWFKFTAILVVYLKTVLYTWRLYYIPGDCIVYPRDCIAYLETVLYTLETVLYTLEIVLHTWRLYCIPWRLYLYPGDCIVYLETVLYTWRLYCIPGDCIV